jgi:hypothetical protein
MMWKRFTVLFQRAKANEDGKGWHGLCEQGMVPTFMVSFVEIHTIIRL